MCGAWAKRLSYDIFGCSCTYNFSFATVFLFFLFLVFEILGFACSTSTIERFSKHFEHLVTGLLVNRDKLNLTLLRY
jgi:hypothetical protein